MGKEKEVTGKKRGGTKGEGDKGKGREEEGKGRRKMEERGRNFVQL